MGLVSLNVGILSAVNPQPSLSSMAIEAEHPGRAVTLPDAQPAVLDFSLEPCMWAERGSVSFLCSLQSIQPLSFISQI